MTLLGASGRGGAASRASNAERRGLERLALSASSMRVLNLANVASMHEADPEYEQRPLFPNRILNTAIILKHRLRANEVDFFNTPRTRATKVIIPMARGDLSLGGFSVFIEERGWIDRLREHVKELTENSPDIHVLRVLDDAPSLDPFLLSLILDREGYRVAPCYFGLLQADIDRMRQFVATEIGALIRLAMPELRAEDTSSARLVDAIMTDADDARLTILSRAMQMSESEFRAGLFAWKGVLYYKWQHQRLLTDASGFLQSLKAMRITGPVDPDTSHELQGLLRSVRLRLRGLHMRVAEILGDYDRAYRKMTADGEAQPFRRFLLSATTQFTVLSEAISVAADIVGFWRHLYPGSTPPAMPADAACAHLRVFEDNLVDLMAGPGWEATVDTLGPLR